MWTAMSCKMASCITPQPRVWSNMTPARARCSRPRNSWRARPIHMAWPCTMASWSPVTRASVRPVSKAPEAPAPAMFLRSALSDFTSHLPTGPGLPIVLPGRSAMAAQRDKDTAIRLDEWSPRLLKSRLYQRILVDIIIGILAPGEQLDENVLAERYGGGLAGVREALARLALEGLVV